MHEVQFVDVILQLKQLVSHNVHNGLVASVPSLNLPKIQILKKIKIHILISK